MSLSASKGGMGGIEPAATTFTESYAKPLQHTPRQGKQWTAGESNPNLRCAEPASSRWTSSPNWLEGDGCRAVLKNRPRATGRFFKTALQPPSPLIPDGLEPSLPGCKPAVVA